MVSRDIGDCIACDRRARELKFGYFGMVMAVGGQNRYETREILGTYHC